MSLYLAINGYKLAEQASREFPDLKVLLTSGFTGKARSKQQLSQPNLTSNIISKPYSQHELTIRIRALPDENCLRHKAILKQKQLNNHC